MNYYNEHEPFAVDWLRELIRRGLIADGVVDDRSIAEVSAADLADFRQCHFFSGIGGWPLAFRLAGITDDEPIWSGSAPCQGFSRCGKQAGFNDPRDLWPCFFNLIRERRPHCLFGEQSNDSPEWLDRTADDLEGIGYAFAPAAIPALAVSAKQQRERLYFVAYAAAFDGGAHDRVGESRERRPSEQSGRLPGLHVAGRWWQAGEGAERLPTLVRNFNGLSGILGGFGNAIVPQLAAEFIQASREAIAGLTI